MPNFIDYTKYYGDKSFEEVPFNDIDALILAELSYLNLSDVSDEFPNTVHVTSPTVSVCDDEYDVLPPFFVNVRV